jgi:hypothetical protein
MARYSGNVHAFLATPCDRAEAFSGLALALAGVGLLQRRVLQCGAADQRVRHPHGIGCAARGCATHRGAVRKCKRESRPCFWPGAEPRAGQGHHALGRKRYARSLDCARSLVAGDCGSRSRLSNPRATSPGCRSYDSAAMRVRASKRDSDGTPKPARFLVRYCRRQRSFDMGCRPARKANRTTPRTTEAKRAVRGYCIPIPPAI